MYIRHTGYKLLKKLVHNLIFFPESLFINFNFNIICLC